MPALRLLTGRMIAGLVPAILLSSAVMAKVPTFGSSDDVPFTCAASGLAHLKPRATPAQVCALFKRKVDAAIGRPTRSVAALPPRGNSVRIAVRIDSPRSASASLTVVARGKTTHYPELTIDVMDKSLDLSDLDRLANQVARKIG